MNIVLSYITNIVYCVPWPWEVITIEWTIHTSRAIVTPILHDNTKVMYDRYPILFTPIFKENHIKSIWYLSSLTGFRRSVGFSKFVDVKMTVGVTR